MNKTLGQVIEKNHETMRQHALNSFRGMLECGLVDYLPYSDPDDPSRVIREYRNGDKFYVDYESPDSEPILTPVAK
jgi:hypothetical protein